jgi:hypothetical protein
MHIKHWYKFGEKNLLRECMYTIKVIEVQRFMTFDEISNFSVCHLNLEKF